MLHPRALAHLGDAVYELWVREWAVKETDKAQELHRYTTKRVQASTQAAVLEKLIPELTDPEKDLLKRAQNMPVPTARRSNQAVYRKATALEALIGNAYFQDSERLAQFKTMIIQALSEILQSESQ